MKTAATFSFLAVLVSVALSEIPAPQVLHHFRGGAANPIAPLVLGPDGNFYGTSPSGGSSGRGTVFRITPDGISTMLITFTGPNRQTPWNVGLKFDSKGNLYGATERGGSSNPIVAASGRLHRAFC